MQSCALKYKGKKYENRNYDCNFIMMIGLVVLQEAEDTVAPKK